jgi:CRP/FNR family transcriptional regulator
MWENIMQKSALFEGLSRDELRPVIAMGRKIRLKDKETLFFEGEEKNAFYILGKGTILISKLTEEGSESLINVLGEGETFPHTGFFKKTFYPGTATAKKDVTVLAIPIDKFELFVRDNPELMFRIIEMMNSKIIYLQKKLNEVLSLNVASRLKAAMAYLHDTQGKHIILTHQELGNIIGASRETVSRQLKKWEREGWLEVKKDKIILNSTVEL